MRTKCTQLVTIVAAVLALAAAPTTEESGAGRSPWSRMVERAKAMVHDPFGREHRDARGGKVSAPMGVQRSQHDTAADAKNPPGPAADRGVRQASASRPIAKSAGGAKPSAAASKRPSWLARVKRKPRTVSEYMAQEKP
jgi:hypothetical protein